MTVSKVQTTAQAEVSAEDIRAVRFNRVIGRGYEQHEVDAFVDKCAAWIDWFNVQLDSAQRDLARFQQEIADDGGEQAVQVLTNAQQTADTTVRQADQYSLRVMSEAKQLHEEARSRTAALEQEAQVMAKRLTEDATVQAERLQRESIEQADALLASTREQVEVLERDAAIRAEQLLTAAAAQAAAVDAGSKDRLQQLGAMTAARQAELDRQTAYLLTLRDSSRVQLQKFLEGLLDHLADEFGRADPAAAHAAAGGRPAGNGAGGSRRLVGRPKRGTRRSVRAVPAGQGLPNAIVPAQRRVEQA